MGIHYYVVNTKRKTYTELGKNFEWILNCLELFTDPDNKQEELLDLLLSFDRFLKDGDSLIWVEGIVDRISKVLLNADLEDYLLIGDDVWVNYKGESGTVDTLETYFCHGGKDYTRV